MDHLVLTFLALSDIARLRIFNVIVEAGELCVCDIVRVMGFTQTKTSRHLAILKKAGLVRSRKVGLWVLYSVERPSGKDRQAIIENLITLLKSNDVARIDSKKLMHDIRTGCCATPDVPQNKCCPSIIKK